MDYTTYLTHKINKIEFKQAELDNLNLMLTHYTPSLETELTDILRTHNINYIPPINTNKKTSPTYQHRNQDKPLSLAIYKKLAMVTHPDKEPANIDFVQIKEAYDNNDTYSLIKYSVKYNLVEDKSESSVAILILEKKLSELKSALVKIKSTIGYKLLLEGNIDTHINIIKSVMK